MGQWTKDDYVANVCKYAKQANEHRHIFVDVEREEIRVETPVGDRYIQFKEVCRPELLLKVEDSLLEDKVHKCTLNAFRTFCADGMMVGLSNKWPLVYDN